MPKSLYSTKPKGDKEISLGGIDKHPRLAAKVMRVIATWSHIELLWYHLLLTRITADYLLISAAIESSLGYDAGRKMVRKVMEQKLSEDELGLFTDVEKAIESSRKVRNSFAHGHWCWTPEVPDALVLLNPKRMFLGFSAVYEHQDLTEFSTYQKDSKVYGPEDLNAEIERATQAEELAKYFFRVITCEVADASRWRKELRVLLQTQKS